MPRILNFGSLNIDHVYRLPHIVRDGETLASQTYTLYPGGKGANQSVALARAGASITHAGKVGADAQWLIDNLTRHGVDASLVTISDTPTGHAIIQVDDAGQNAIVLYPGANLAITRTEIDAALATCAPGDVLLLQNEINEVPYLIEQGAKLNLRVCINPAPFDDAVTKWPLHLIDTLVVNETEAEGLVGSADIDALAKRISHGAVILTRGSDGATYQRDNKTINVSALAVKAIDTTAAGDTFLGYYLAGITEGIPVKDSLTLAARAAAICVTRQGATDAIPQRAELDD